MDYHGFVERVKDMKDLVDINGKRLKKGARVAHATGVDREAVLRTGVIFAVETIENGERPIDKGSYQVVIVDDVTGRKARIYRNIPNRILVL
jgi:hypothetical protein